MITFDTLDQAIRIANQSEYGLAAAIWTSNLTTAHDTARRLRAGTVWVNCHEAGGDMNVPYFRERRFGFSHACRNLPGNTRDRRGSDGYSSAGSR